MSKEYMKTLYTIYTMLKIKCNKNMFKKKKKINLSLLFKIFFSLI